MPEQVRCPECDATLRVPDHLLGKNVKCPRCKQTFTAQVEREVDELEEAETEPEPEPPRPRKRPVIRDEDEEEEERSRPRKRSAARDEDEEEEEERPRPRRRPSSRDDDEDGDEEEEEDRPRRRRRRRRGGNAAAMVTGPAIALLVVGILGVLVGIANVVYTVAAGGDPTETTSYKMGTYIGSFASVIWGFVVLSGGLYMKGLRNRGSVMTACIFAMLPCNPCCLLGLPFGIWALVVLNNPQVTDAFS
jgi:predicted Zn finger-like uncharacterized protein